jgi:vacuolar-type H+-ATPase subunit I/STV1
MMCKYIKSNKEKCKIKSKGEYCHFHKKYEIDQFKQNEIKNLNKVINNKRLQYEKLLEIKQDMINELSASLSELTVRGVIENEMKDREIQELKNRIKQLEQDAKNYKIIKQFEKEKQELINKGIDIYNYQNDEWHQRRQQRNLVAHAIY